jgi:hypothetical protein
LADPLFLPEVRGPVGPQVHSSDRGGGPIETTPLPSSSGEAAQQLKSLASELQPRFFEQETPDSLHPITESCRRTLSWIRTFETT